MTKTKKKRKPQPLSTYGFLQQFPDEQAAEKYLEGRRWPNGPVCPRCHTDNVAVVKHGRPMPYRCRKCRKHFSIRTGTILAESKVPLHKWLMAIYLLNTARKGIPSTQLARQLGVTQKTAWFLAHRIRRAYEGGNAPLGPAVEIDETYMGGKERNKHASKKLRRGRGAVGKQAVLGMVERDGGVRAMPVSKTDRRTIHEVIRRHVEPGSIIYTDEHAAYVGMVEYGHEPVRHGAGEYVRAMASTNGVESFWALLKRGYYGIYHYMSVKHLHRYVREFARRHNDRHMGTMAVVARTADALIHGQRLTWEALTDGPA